MSLVYHHLQHKQMSLGSFKLIHNKFFAKNIAFSSIPAPNPPQFDLQLVSDQHRLRSETAQSLHWRIYMQLRERLKKRLSLI